MKLGLRVVSNTHALFRCMLLTLELPVVLSMTRLKAFRLPYGSNFFLTYVQHRHRLSVRFLSSSAHVNKFRNRELATLLSHSTHVSCLGTACGFSEVGRPLGKLPPAVDMSLL